VPVRRHGLLAREHGRSAGVVSGTWISVNGEVETCKRSDWKGPAQSDNDRLINITPKVIEEWESACRFTSVKVIKTPNGYQSSIDDPVLVTMTCDGDGMTNKLSEMWRIHKVAGLTLMITADAAKHHVAVYQKCR
jgi:hypothetical protein